MSQKVTTESLAKAIFAQTCPEGLDETSIEKFEARTKWQAYSMLAYVNDNEGCTSEDFSRGKGKPTKVYEFEGSFSDALSALVESLGDVADKLEARAPTKSKLPSRADLKSLSPKQLAAIAAIVATKTE